MTTPRINVVEGDAFQTLHHLSLAVNEVARGIDCEIPQDFPRVFMELGVVGKDDDVRTAMIISCLHAKLNGRTVTHQLRRALVSYDGDNRALRVDFEEFAETSMLCVGDDPAQWEGSPGDEDDERVAGEIEALQTPEKVVSLSVGWSNDLRPKTPPSYSDIMNYTARDIFDFFLTGIVVDKLG